MRAAHALVALLVLLAGCSGGLPGGAAQDGTVQVYVSDDPGAIEEFDHLNVTITSFSLRAAAPAGEHDDGGHHRHRHEGNWTAYDINETTVDLTQLRGVNASLLHAVGVPNGEYTAVAVDIAGVNGTLENGRSVTVKAPGDRLVVEKSFTVGGNESVNFVVDAVVRERKDNETYVLKPHLNASGTNVEVRRHCGGCGDHHDGDGCSHHGWNGSHHNLDGDHEHHDGDMHDSTETETDGHDGCGCC